MSDIVKELAQKLLKTGYDDLPPRDQRVLKGIASRARITRSLDEDLLEGRTFGQRLADKVAEFGGSWTFIMLFMGFLLVWSLINTLMLRDAAFDPYPYVFLNLILSMIAAIQAPIIMMSQNRQAARDRLIAANDYEVNLKAELEIMGLHEKLDRMRADDLTRLIEQQSEQIRVLGEFLSDSKRGAGR